MDGTFELKNVPTGKELTVEFWHEAKDVFKTQPVTLKEGETKELGDIPVDPSQLKTPASPVPLSKPGC